MERSSVFGLLGVNGAGKTTLLKMIATLTKASHGEIRIEGIDALAAPQRVRRLLGIALADDRSFYYRLTGRQNLEFFGALAGLKGRTLRARIDAVTEDLDLGTHIDRHYAGFSTGLRHRLVLARALLADPPILLLDEPTRAVDPAHAAKMRALVRERLCRREGKTIVLATNSLEEAWNTCDRVGVIRDGCVDGSHTPEALRTMLAGASRVRIRLMFYDTKFLDALANCEEVVDCAGTAGDVDGEIDLAIAHGAGLNRVLHVLIEAGAGVRSVESLAPDSAAAFSALTGADRL